MTDIAARTGLFLRCLALGMALVGSPWLTMPALAQPATAYPFDGMVVIDTPHGFDTLWDRVATAVADQGMLVVSRASASRAAAGRGIAIPGNGIVDVFRNDYAVRLLSVSVPAGIVAPIRFYLTEEADGTATLTYRRPGAILAPFSNPEIDAIAAELDRVFAAIAAAAAAP